MNDELLSLAQEVGAVLQDRGWMLATSESCTGGGVAQAVTEIAGSSCWFDRGFVTYSNQAKMDLLHVSAEILDQHGAVSNETAAAMCRGALKNSQAQVALSTTGIAGPAGAVPGKPVGTVCFGWAIGEQISVERMQFDGDRHSVREQSVIHALRGLLARLPA